MTTNNLPPFEKVFGWLGLQDDNKYYKAAAALPSLFFAMQEEDREKLLQGWIEAIEGFKHYSFDEFDYEDILISESLQELDPVEKESAEIIQFKPKK